MSSLYYMTSKQEIKRQINIQNKNKFKKLRKFHMFSTILKNKKDNNFSYKLNWIKQKC